MLILAKKNTTRSFHLLKETEISNHRYITVLYINKTKGESIKLFYLRGNHASPWLFKCQLKCRCSAIQQMPSTVYVVLSMVYANSCIDFRVLNVSKNALVHCLVVKSN